MNCELATHSMVRRTRFALGRIYAASMKVVFSIVIGIETMQADLGEGRPVGVLSAMMSDGETEMGGSADIVPFFSEAERSDALHDFAEAPDERHG